MGRLIYCRPGHRGFSRNYLSVLLITALFFMGGGCKKALDIKDPQRTPVAVFEEAWKVLDERYALFSVKGVDWAGAYQTYRGKVSDTLSERGLFQVLKSLLATLKDGHVALITPTDTAIYTGFYTAYPFNFNYNNILNNYLKNDYRKIGPMILKLQDNIGYIYYGSFANDLSEAQADTLIAAVQSTRGLILDVRSNTGGQSLNIDRLFRRFIMEKRLVKYEMSKKGPGHDDFSDAQPYSLSPAGQTYKSPVIVLTNRACFSACNDFVSYMSLLPNVRLMGDQTGGGGSIPQDYILANGWKLQYSSTVTLSPDRKSIEGGIPPAVNIGITPADEANGKDPILEKAFMSLQ